MSPYRRERDRWLSDEYGETRGVFGECTELQVLLQEVPVICYTQPGGNDPRSEARDKGSIPVQMAPLRSRHYPVRGAVVPALCVELS
jgi:hypothetical protein